MKNLLKISAILLSTSIIFTILFQALHSYEHYLMHVSEKHCNHHSESKSDITHEHQSFEKCYTCEFTFSTFINQTPQIFLLHPNSSVHIAGASYQYNTLQPFAGLVNSLRGPPIS